MKQSTKQYAGVWMDNSKAIIISKGADSDGGEYAVQDNVKVKDSHAGGNEHTINNAQKTDTLKYYKSLSNLLVSYDEILIFGPGKAQEQFQNHLKQDAQFKNKQVTIDSAEHLTDPQMIAKVRDFFKLKQ